MHGDGAAAVQLGPERVRRLRPRRLARAACCARSTTSRCASSSGPTATLAADPAPALLAKAPAASGVYARFEDGGRRLALLDADGAVVRTAGAGAGLIAATRYLGQPPVWYVTGTDAAGVAAAVRAFGAGTLDGHFAVAVVADAAIPLPDGGR